MPLARSFYNIDQRGVMMDPLGLENLRNHIELELGKEIIQIEQIVKRPCVSQKGLNDPAGAFNLSAPPQVMKVLLDLGLKLPKKRGTGKESTDEETLQVVFAESGHPILKSILRVRELNKILGTYVNCRLSNNIFYTSYVVAGTVSGRRSSRKNWAGLGANAQNQPKHSDLGKLFRACIIARPGKIFLSCDQIQAEDWIVCGIITFVSGRRSGLDELLNNIDRHRRLATFIFAKPWDECGKDTLFRYLAKKTRHAGNYGMQANKMAAVMATEGFSITKSQCEYFLHKFHEAEPDIQGVFQKYVEAEIGKTRELSTPIGRKRYFLGCRPFGDNGSIFRDAYSYIPQSTVGDNTGLAILHCESTTPGLVVMDIHDAIVLEVDDNVEAVHQGVRLLTNAFDRELPFPNGLKIKIPIEFELGYDMKGMAKCDDLSVTGLAGILNGLSRFQNRQNLSTSGVPQPSLQHP